jgi:putative transposase
MKLLKGESAHHANEAKLFAPDFDWADDYYAVSVSQSHVEAVRNYIKHQETHHQKKTFAEECQEFITQYGFVRMLG